MSALPFVSVVIPCRNEERHIASCLDSFVATDYPGERLEILVVDGVSSDRTKAIVADFMRKYPFVRLIDNPKGIIPAAMNTGIRNARGQVIIKVDAHSTYPRDYVSRCVKSLDEYQTDNVGGVLQILPGDETTMAKAIAFALSHPFGSGNAYIKIGSREPRWADTAAFGCYKREVFDRVGMWNEQLAGSSDIDFNVRLRKAGGKILLVPEIRIYYHADSNLRSYWLHNFADGVWATYVIKFGSKAWAWRHWIPLAFISSLLGSAVLVLFFPVLWKLFFGVLGSYVIANLAASAQISIRERNAKYLFSLPLAFAIRHFAHGLGALYGLLLLMLPGNHWKGRRGAKS